MVDDILGWPAVSPPVTPTFLLREVFRIFSIGLANEALPAWAALGFAGLLGAGLLAARRGGRAALPLFVFGVPPLLMLLLSLDRPFWNAKFLLVALPGYHLLLAQGAAWLVARAERLGARGGPASARLLAGAVALFAVLAVAPTLANEYGNPRFWRDDYRAIARTVAAQAGPNDAVILNGGGQLEIWGYYDEGTLPVYPMPPSRPIDPDATRAQLETIAAQHERVWVLWWAEQQGDPEGVIPRWLGEHAFEAGSRWFGDVRLASYRLGELPVPEPLDVRWALPDGAARLLLRGASVEPLTVVAGEVVALNSEWEGQSAVPVTFFAQLLDGGNHVVGQYDGSGGAPPVAEWAGAETLRLGIPVAVGTPPGDYSLVIGAYDAASGQRLVTSEGADSLRLATVRVEKPAVPPTVEALALRPGEARAQPFGAITLIGARANKLGFDHAPDTPLARGEPLGVLLFWRAERDAPAAPSLQLQLLDGRTVAAEWQLEPTEGRYPPPAWSAGEVVRDPQIRFLPGDLAPGRYRLVLVGADARAEVGEVVVGE